MWKQWDCPVIKDYWINFKEEIGKNAQEGNTGNFTDAVIYS